MSAECIFVPGRALDAVGVDQLRRIAAATVIDDLTIPVVLPISANRTPCVAANLLIGFFHPADQRVVSEFCIERIARTDSTASVDLVCFGLHFARRAIRYFPRIKIAIIVSANAPRAVFDHVVQLALKSNDGLAAVYAR